MSETVRSEVDQMTDREVLEDLLETHAGTEFGDVIERILENMEGDYAE